MSYSKVNGERNPAEVYNDFRSSVLQILSAHKNSTSVAIPNGMAVHLNNDTVRQGQENTTHLHSDGSGNNQTPDPIYAEHGSQPITYPRVIFVVGKYIQKHLNIYYIWNSFDNDNSKIMDNKFIFVGGPGSNKSSLCQKVLRANTSWRHMSMGSFLRSLATSQEPLQETISCGRIVEEVV